MKHRARSYSDTAPVTAQKPRSPGNKLRDAGALISAPTPTERDVADACAYLEERGCADIAVILGLADPAPSGAMTEDCPTCSRPLGVPCVTTGGGAMNRPHVARSRRADAAELERQRQAADVLLDEVLAEATT